MITTKQTTITSTKTLVEFYCECGMAFDMEYQANKHYAEKHAIKGIVWGTELDPDNIPRGFLRFESEYDFKIWCNQNCTMRQKWLGPGWYAQYSFEDSHDRGITFRLGSIGEAKESISQAIEELQEALESLEGFEPNQE